MSSTKTLVAQYMNQEKKNKPNQITQERQLDQGVIEKNRALFWLVSTVACEQSEHGAIVVDMEEPQRKGDIHSFISLREK